MSCVTSSLLRIYKPYKDLHAFVDTYFRIPLLSFIRHLNIKSNLQTFIISIKKKKNSRKRNIIKSLVLKIFFWTSDLCTTSQRTLLEVQFPEPCVTQKCRIQVEPLSPGELLFETRPTPDYQFLKRIRSRSTQVVDRNFVLANGPVPPH